MNEKIKKTIDDYCQRELDNFKRSDIFKSIEMLAKNKKLIVKCSIGKEYNKPDSNNQYLGIEILDNNKPMEIFDEGTLGYATILVLVDKKQRIKFYSWDDDDFIDSLKRIKEELKHFEIH